ncbi:MAG TPA: response regulator [Bacteroidales bacterium]|nr:response regulator [Bacteroidales bacterium]
MVINCIIVEDEPLALKRTNDFVSRVPYLNLLATFTNGFEAIGFVKEHDIDLMFLDIEMDGFTGIELIESLSRKPQIIITTAYDKYALKGFELHVADYLLKPFGFDRFLNSVERVYESIEKESKEEKNYIFVKTEYRLERIAVDDIIFIEGMGDYRNIRTTSKKTLTLQTFSELEKLLPKNLFCRVHKSYIVSINKIISVERHRIKMIDNLIPISDSYKEGFYSLIGIKGDN